MQEHISEVNTWMQSAFLWWGRWPSKLTWYVPRTSWYNYSHWLPIAWVWYHLMQSGHTGRERGEENSICARIHHIMSDKMTSLRFGNDLINRWELDTPDASPVPLQDTHCTAITYTPQLHKQIRHEEQKCVLCTTRSGCISVNGGWVRYWLWLSCPAIQWLWVYHLVRHPLS